MGRFVTVALVAVIAMVGGVVVDTPAEAISCVGAGDVTAVGSCMQGGLNFQVAHDPSPTSLSDILFLYTVKADASAGAVNGVDLFNPGQNVTIREVFCGTAFVNGVCTSELLANLTVTPNSSLAVSFDPDSTIFIRKDIQFRNNSFLSEFTQSHDTTGAPTPVPGPATLLLLGSSLAGLGMASRRKARNKAAQAAV
jgi:hypothetical protein